MNKAKLFVISLISIFIISLIGFIILSIYLLSNIDLNFNNIVSYTQVSKIEEQNIDSNKYMVIDVVDGDTIKVLENGEKKTIRLIGINAPEVKSKDCKYQEATDTLSSLILNKEVNLESDSTQSDLDKYGRQLRYIFLNGININQEIIKDGLAVEYTYNKAYKFKDDFLTAQSSAKLQKIGLWSNDCIIK